MWFFEKHLLKDGISRLVAMIFIFLHYFFNAVSMTDLQCDFKSEFLDIASVLSFRDKFFIVHLLL